MIDDDNEAIVQQLGVSLNAVHEDHDHSQTPPMRPPMNARQNARPKAAMINAEVVKQRRKALSMTQVTLAIMAGTNPRTIALIERNKQLDPPLSVALRIAKALSITVEALTRGSEPYSARTIRPVMSQDHGARITRELGSPYDPETGR